MNGVVKNSTIHLIERTAYRILDHSFPSMKQGDRSELFIHTETGADSLPVKSRVTGVRNIRSDVRMLLEMRKWFRAPVLAFAEFRESDKSERSWNQSVRAGFSRTGDSAGTQRRNSRQEQSAQPCSSAKARTQSQCNPGNASSLGTLFVEEHHMNLPALPNFFDETQIVWETCKSVPKMHNSECYVILWDKIGVSVLIS